MSGTPNWVSRIQKINKTNDFTKELDKFFAAKEAIYKRHKLLAGILKKIPNEIDFDLVIVDEHIHKMHLFLDFGEDITLSLFIDPRRDEEEYYVNGYPGEVWQNRGYMNNLYSPSVQWMYNDNEDIIATRLAAYYTQTITSREAHKIYMEEQTRKLRNIDVEV